MDNDVANQTAWARPSGGRGEGWVMIQIALFAGIIVLPTHLGGLPEWPETVAHFGRIAGVGLGVLGAIIGALGLLKLGPNLTAFPRPKSNGTLVQSGIYRIVRHPIYCGAILMALGWSLFHAATPALVLALLLIPFFDRKARREEQWLQNKFPEYADYRRRVRKLFPWIY